MSHFKSGIDKIKESIDRCKHDGKEVMLQKAILCGLTEDKEDIVFSNSVPNKINNQYMGTTGYGRELGCSKLEPKKVNRYVDIALAKIDKSEEKDPVSITNLCEVKIVAPKNYHFKGSWYQYVYKQTNAPVTFDFLQEFKIFGKIVTDADEGQIIFDFIKMMAVCQKISGSEDADAELYQVFAVKKHANIQSFENCRARLVEVLEAWSRHCSLSMGSALKIYKWEDFVNIQHGGQKIALECKLNDVIGCEIIDLGLDLSENYIHVLLDWQPKKYDFKFKSKKK